MTADSLATIVVDTLKTIAPEIDPASVPSMANLRDELDLDSMDFLRFVVALHTRLGVEIPESDYHRLSTLDGAVQYLTERRTAPR